MWIGSWKDHQDTPFGIRWVKELPLLGATFSVGDYTKPTWEKPVAKLEHRLSSWQGRQLSLQGKATVINVLALSQIWHLCHVFPIPEWANKRITKAVWSFFWSGKKDLVARATVCLPKSQGGFGVINFDRLANRFKMSHVDANCFCRADVETLEHLFFECELARLLVGWVYFNLMQVDPVATPFSVVELLFGFSLERRRSIPLVIIWMLHVMKHVIWVARCDFRFRDVMPVASECLKKAFAKIKFVLCLQARKCKSPFQFRSYEREWLARGTLGHFEGEELVFSF